MSKTVKKETVEPTEDELINAYLEARNAVKAAGLLAQAQEAYLKQ